MGKEHTILIKVEDCYDYGTLIKNTFSLRNTKERIFPGFSIQGLGLLRISSQKCSYFALFNQGDCLAGNVRSKTCLFFLLLQPVGDHLNAICLWPSHCFLSSSWETQLMTLVEQ